GFYRLMIWENGLANVWANPFVGLGLNDWERPLWMVSSTVDAFWLVIAMRGGLPALLLLVTGIGLMIRGVVRRLRKADARRQALARGWIISLIALALVGCTVHYWNVPFAYLFFFVGLGGCLADPRKGRVTAREARRVEEPATGLRWVAPDGGSAGPAWPVPVAAGGHR
ncbi:MAG: hypothetical protein JSS20_11180, partial [Proteobacteria bacterium]|nr:hypothetical protein [Pseudomonadota bacterium]